MKLFVAAGFVLLLFVTALRITAAADRLAATSVPVVTDPVIYTDPDKPMDVRIDDLIRRMSLSEKAGQLVNAAAAIPRLHVPEYNYWSEALHGVARNGHATVFPQAIGMAATWDPEKIRQVGEVIADEARAKYNQAQRDGQNGEDHGLTFWAPNINIFRDPRWGRGQETYGEDPFLTARLAVNFIEGLQTTRGGYLEAMACAKHFAVHSGPESTRHTADVNPTLRDLYETYLPQFQAAVEEAHVGAVMAAYSAVDGVPMPANKWLLTDVLRKTWGFDGHIVSDCGAVGDVSGGHHYAANAVEGSADCLKAGLDLECGGQFRNLPQAVAQGLITEGDLDRALHRVLTARFRLGMFDPPGRVPFSAIAMSEVESPEHLALARQIARESIVLLKNDHVLPLDESKLRRLVVLGANATARLNGNYEGLPSRQITVLDGLRAEAGSGVQVDYFLGTPLTYPPGKAGKVVAADYRQALAAARRADVVIYVGGLDASLESEESNYESPGFAHGDRTRIELPAAQEKLLHALAATGRPVIFINASGSAIAMPWEAKHLPAVLQIWYPGGEGGAAVADVLFGKYNPAGRLPVTFYAKTTDLPDFPNYDMARRTYRYFSGHALWPFGYGLSYTSFAYLPVTLGAATVGPRDTVHLAVPVENSGDRDGDEVVQIYARRVGLPEPEPIRSLVAFRRISVARGATANVAFDIPVASFHEWSAERQGYVVDPGQVELEVGASSGDIRRTVALTVTGG